MGVNSLPKTVSRQRRGCDLNPGPTAPESSMLTTRLPSHPGITVLGIYHATRPYEYWAMLQSVCLFDCRLRQVRRRIGQEVTQQLVLALIMSRLDYCNSMLAGLLTSTLQPLQRLQNAAAQLMFGLSHSDHVTPTLIQLHWLPVSYRIK